jgi:hypothetical protein
MFAAFLALLKTLKYILATPDGAASISSSLRYLYGLPKLHRHRICSILFLKRLNKSGYVCCVLALFKTSDRIYWCLWRRVFAQIWDIYLVLKTYHNLFIFCSSLKTKPNPLCLLRPGSVIYILDDCFEVCMAPAVFAQNCNRYLLCSVLLSKQNLIIHVCCFPILFYISKNLLWTTLWRRLYLLKSYMRHLSGR